MKQVFIPEKSVFDNAFDEKSPKHKSAVEFLNFLADQKSFKRYYIAFIPLSLMNQLKEKNFFKITRAYETIWSFVDVDQSVSSDNLDEDCFKLAEVKAITFKPTIVANREDSFSLGHTTYVVDTNKVMKDIKDMNLEEDL
jgi:hypothetical protein